MVNLQDPLQRYRDRFGRLVVNARSGGASPHKICMLLAVLDLALAGGLRENLVRYAPPLLERYVEPSFTGSNAIVLITLPQPCALAPRHAAFGECRWRVRPATRHRSGKPARPRGDGR